jgi:hypothetical protein
MLSHCLLHFSRSVAADSHSIGAAIVAFSIFPVPSPLAINQLVLLLSPFPFSSSVAAVSQSIGGAILPVIRKFNLQAT